jgi:hypothetical protein
MGSDKIFQNTCTKQFKETKPQQKPKPISVGTFCCGTEHSFNFHITTNQICISIK